MFQAIDRDFTGGLTRQFTTGAAVMLLLFIAGCSNTAPILTTASDYDCATPRQSGDWSRIDERDKMGQWHEYINGEGKRFRSARLDERSVNKSMAKLFSGGAEGLVEAFDTLRQLAGKDVEQLNLVELEFGTDPRNPQATLVVEADSGETQDRRGLLIREGDGFYDLVQLRGAGTDLAVIKSQLRSFTSGCTAIE